MTEFTQADSFANPAVQRCPFPLIERLHAEAPVYVDPLTGFYIVTRYDDIGAISADPVTFTNKTSLIMGKSHSPVAAELNRRYAERGFARIHTLVTNDPPEHGKFRAVVDKIFSPSFVKSLEPYITQVATALLDEFVASGETDLLHAFCLKLPMFVIADQLGVPRDEWRRFKAWSDAEIEAINPALPAERDLELCELLIEAQNYLYDRAKEFRDAPENKLLSMLAHAEVDGRPIAPEELVGIAEQLLVAGNETTTSALAIAAATLIREPAVAARLHEDRSKIGPFVEEVLRLHAPSPHLYREALVDTEVGGVAIPKGATLQLSYLAGNRDPSHYGCPADLDLDRTGVKNHLAFGRGIHFCIGNQLARAELRIAVGLLLDRLPGLRFSPDHPEPQFAESYHVHTLDQLHVVFDGERVTA